MSRYILTDMHTHTRGFALATVLLVVLGLALVSGAGYVAMNPEVLKKSSGDAARQENTADASAKMAAGADISVSWRIADAGEVDGIPRTSVTAIINGTEHDMGTFTGSCSELGASGGVDGKGLLAGELSAVQCWYAGGGDEIGVFANEGGGIDIMVGALDEGTAETPGVRGGFEVKSSIMF